MLYHRLVKPLLFALPPEAAHDLGIFSLRVIGGTPSLAAALRGHFAPENSRLASRHWDLQFPSPVGLAAGFDKNGVALEGFAALGFGFLECGTVTPLAQPGNPRPRLFRLPADGALINRLGFNNHGMNALARALADTRVTIPLGVNLGKNKLTPDETAAGDYRKAAATLRERGNYFVVNVSSPNTPGLRALQSPAAIAEIARAVAVEISGRPLLVKFAPDLTDDELADSMRAAEAAGAAGFLLTNTTLARAGLRSPNAGEAGGLSGAPLSARALAVLRALRPVTARPLIGVGGIMNAGDLFARLSAGADLCQIYTGLVYGGPGFVGELLRGLETRMNRLGLSSLAALCGSGASDPGE